MAADSRDQRKAFGPAKPWLSPQTLGRLSSRKCGWLPVKPADFGCQATVGLKKHRVGLRRRQPGRSDACEEAISSQGVALAAGNGCNQAPPNRPRPQAGVVNIEWLLHEVHQNGDLRIRSAEQSLDRPVEPLRCRDGALRCSPGRRQRPLLQELSLIHI